MLTGDSKKLTALQTSFVSVHLSALPFCLVNVPAAFNGMISVFGEIPSVRHFVDYVLSNLCTFTECIDLLRLVAGKPRRTNMSVKSSKWEMGEDCRLNTKANF